MYRPSWRSRFKPHRSPSRQICSPPCKKIKAACEANGYNFATYNVTMIQRDIPYETALAQCIESDDVAAGEI